MEGGKRRGREKGKIGGRETERQRENKIETLAQSRTLANIY